MNKIDAGAQLAIVRYEDADYTVLRKGGFVRCAVSGALIPLEELRYWSVDAQEAYRGPMEAVERWKQLKAAAQ